MSTFLCNFQKLNVIVKQNWVQWRSSTGTTSKMNFLWPLDPESYFPEEESLSYALTKAHLSLGPSCFLFNLHIPYKWRTLGTLAAGGTTMTHGTAEECCVLSVMCNTDLTSGVEGRYRCSSTLWSGCSWLPTIHWITPLVTGGLMCTIGWKYSTQQRRWLLHTQIDLG